MRVSELVQCLQHYLELFLKGRKLPIENITMVIPPHAMQLNICARDDVLISHEQQSLQLNIDCLLVIGLTHLGTRLGLLFAAYFQVLKD
jgi:hypothetical protein